MSDVSILERLSTHRALGSVPRAELEWLAANGVLRHLAAGDVVSSKGRDVEGLHIVLAGRLAIYVDRGAGLRRDMEWHSGDVTGVMPYSRIGAPPGDVKAMEPSEILTVFRNHMAALIRECPEVTAILVHSMVDRARAFTSQQVQDEKLVSLGKLSAGLAHELNNPASAIARSARSLQASLAQADAASRALGSQGLSPEQLAMLERVRDGCAPGAARAVLSPLQQEEREDGIAAWLQKNKAAIDCAEPLADTDINVAMLDQLAASLDGPALNAALRWLASGCATRRMTAEIHEASSRIYDLVAAIKGFSQMDRGQVPEPVDIEQGLANTVVVLRSKAKGKSIGLTMKIEKDLPRVTGYAGELNQVWSNLIDNALDAVSERGKVELTARREDGAVVVRVIDDGPGVPADLQERIFEPFFTTKDVGKGTGLGLDIVRRLVQRNNGLIELESRPGRSEFRVILPLPANSAKGGTA
jgi:signal transduction histidine kinase